MSGFIDQDGFRADYEDDTPRERTRWHWCDVCHGHTGAGSPCALDEPEDEPEEESDCCPGCNPEPTISELESGKCDSCGKELS